MRNVVFAADFQNRRNVLPGANIQTFFIEYCQRTCRSGFDMRIPLSGLCKSYGQMFADYVLNDLAGSLVGNKTNVQIEIVEQGRMMPVVV